MSGVCRLSIFFRKKLFIYLRTSVVCFNIFCSNVAS
nr:MAG TPA: hypothetical protein [Bacteriophage sp.]